MFGGYFLNIHDTSGSETDVNFQRMCQKFILQKERQVFIKCILRNVHNSYVFVDIGRRYCGRETVTPSNSYSNIPLHFKMILFDNIPHQPHQFDNLDSTHTDNNYMHYQLEQKIL